MAASGLAILVIRDAYDWLVLGCNVLLALVGTGGVIVAIITLRKIRIQAEEMKLQRVAMETTLLAINRQADLMEAQTSHMGTQLTEMQRQSKSAYKSAQASLLNAQAVINSERPWIFVSAKRRFPDQDIFTVNAMNKGRTPALLLDGSVGFIASKSLDDLPQTAPYVHDTLIREKILLPDATAMVWGFSRISIKEALGEKYPPLSWDDGIYVVGTVTYRDLLNPDTSLIHETRWICLFQPSETGDEVIPIEGVGLSPEYERYT